MITRGSARLEAVLRRAGDDPAFRADLLARRGAAALAAGFALTPAERAILDSVGAAQLEATLASLPPEPRASAVTDVPEAPAGIRPEVPVPQGIRPDVPEAPAGIRPDVPPEGLTPRGIRPDVPPEHFDKVKGTRPGLPIVIAAGAVLATGAAFAVCATAGVRPDVPRPAAVSAPAPTAPAPAVRAAPASAPAPAADGGVPGAAPAGPARPR
jgi:hypothetical protein